VRVYLVHPQIAFRLMRTEDACLLSQDADKLLSRGGSDAPESEPESSTLARYTGRRRAPPRPVLCAQISRAALLVCSTQRALKCGIPQHAREDATC